LIDMHKIALRMICMIFAAGSLAGCQSGTPGVLGSSAVNHSVIDLFEKGGEVIGLMNTLTLIKHDYGSGRIMRARARVLAMQKSHRDYEESHRFLKQKIEPARRRVFLHYLRVAKEREAHARWSAAMWAYDQARAVTIKPERMAKKRDEMRLKMRQLRFNKLLKQRRKEDLLLLADMSAYETPKGVSPSDEVYGRMREHYNDVLDDRTHLAFREARRFLRKGLPEIAYVEIESYMRLQPGTAQGRKTLAEIEEHMPRGLLVASLKQAGMKKKHSLQRIKVPEHVNEKQVVAAVKSGNLIKAQQLAQVYRRNDGKHAEKLWAQIQNQLEKKSARLFAQGSKAFAKEKLNQAIEQWSQAVALRPGKAEYQEALRRAIQLKERLSLLREHQSGSHSTSMQQVMPTGPMPEEE